MTQGKPSYSPLHTDTIGLRELPCCNGCGSVEIESSHFNTKEELEKFAIYGLCLPCQVKFEGDSPAREEKMAKRREERDKRREEEAAEVERKEAVIRTEIFDKSYRDGHIYEEFSSQETDEPVTDLSPDTH